MSCYKCDQCQFTTPHSGYLKTHFLYYHSDIRPWKCTYPGCTHKAKTKPNLGQHMEIHENMRKKPHACKYYECGFRTTTRAILHYHISAHHATERSRDFECALCSAKFYTRSMVNTHMQTHLQESRFQCSECKFQTTRKGGLLRHVRNVHGKTNKLSCPSHGCTFSTARADSLKNHLRVVHEPDPEVRRPFPCNFPNCAYRAPFRADLGRHIRRCHDPNRKNQFLCPLCGKTFYDKTALNAHLNLRHLKEARLSKCVDSAPKRHQRVYHRTNCGSDKGALEQLSEPKTWKQMRQVGGGELQDLTILTQMHHKELSGLGNTSPVVMLQKISAQVI